MMKLRQGAVEAAGHLTAVVRRQRDECMHACAQLAVFTLHNPGSTAQRMVLPTVVILLAPGNVIKIILSGMPRGTSPR